MNPPFDWNEQAVEILTRLWNDGQSASQIAHTLVGVTRNAVIGKVTRLGLIRDEAAIHAARYAIRRATRPAAVPKPKREPRRTSSVRLHAGNISRAKESRSYDPGEKALPPVPVVDASFARPWLERKFGQCAFPLIGTGADVWSCCIATEEKQTYCAAHLKIMTREQTPGQRRTLQRLARYAA